ncbi:cyclic nucleotide-binding and patatin-like phospholipase domain-containing protein [Hyphomicrobium sp. CS1GBMeth3]|uniref:cyclic nucleotide-binding and patatin-like phospholipase domain-containing protein n=1 Tax=Hyphomicrobium sp. CS1GBMeth3 TaxID=1892845 RepID=UPI00092FDA15|nr:cyclic nucleotide-binding and patatin-like phospholipase domain-containing protein [Hyphomicrobium sp. CS1GBMeth3]
MDLYDPPAGGPTHGSPVHALLDVDLFSDLDSDERAALGARLEQRALRRGDVLMREGDAADALYIVVSGRFAVTLEGRRDPVSEIGAGQPVGEIAFFTGRPRTATVTAMRDSLVLALPRTEFDALVSSHPGIWSALAATLARRLADTTLNSAAVWKEPTPTPRTICVVPAGRASRCGDFLEMLARALGRGTRCVVLSSETAQRLLGADGSFDDAGAIRQLNALEAAHDYVLLIADDDVSPWTEKAIRHADLVLAVARHDDDPEPNAIERLAARYVAPEATRLVLLHPRRGKVSGTARWLAERRILMHHHVALDRNDDVERLVRFIQGRAVGLVAAGGGALAAAHTGAFKALAEAGISFDIMGGTSAGAALAAAFMHDTSPDEIDDAVGEMFVTRHALGRYTVPRYALLDHTVFDAELKRLFGTTDIEDLWLPFFAISSNLSRSGIACHRTGSLWKAIRASASIPALLPPVYTDEGDMLVDGCLLDNVPIKVMRDIKAGPNVVISFKPPMLDRCKVDYEALPSRATLLRLMLNPLRRERLPDAPGLITVLIRALMANRRDFLRELRPEDLSLVLPIPAGVGFLDWHRHRELFQVAYCWTCEELASLSTSGPPTWLTAALEARRGTEER